MSEVTHQDLINLFPEDKDGICQLSNEELSNITKFFWGKSVVPPHGSSITVKAFPGSHILTTSRNTNDGSGFPISNDAYGYRFSPIPSFPENAQYTIYIQGKVITLTVDGKSYSYYSHFGSSAPSQAHGVLNVPPMFYKN